MITYEIPRPLILTFAKDDKPFMSFDQFNNVVQMFRDEFYASQYVEGFIYDIGVRYNFWTVDTVNRYYRHIFFKKIRKPMRISFEIPHVTSNATIPLRITIYDEDGVYFTQEQRVTVERINGEQTMIYPWRKIETIRSFVLSQCEAV